MGRGLTRKDGPRGAWQAWRAGSGVAAVLAACAAAVCLMPMRFQVDGLSMGPGLLPGDVVVIPPGGGASLRRPRRHERWILVADDGTRVVKRIAGLPGESLRLIDGDLEVDGVRAGKGPAALATCGSVVAAEIAPAGDRWEWIEPPMGVLDDAAFDPARTRLLEPVADVGLAVIVTAAAGVPAEGLRVWVDVGPRRVVFRVHDAGPQACVAGRLDGRIVAGGWPAAGGGRSCLPHAAATRWDAEAAWPAGEPVHRLAVVVDPGLLVDGVTVWRDVHLLPAADGVRTWRLGPGEVFVIGDHPAGSRDSRHWGPLPVGRLVGRISSHHPRRRAASGRPPRGPRRGRLGGRGGRCRRPRRPA